MGFGGNYDRFGGGGLLEKIITEHSCFPDFVLCYKYNSIFISVPLKLGRVKY